jgi:hypothetical protein
MDTAVMQSRRAQYFLTTLLVGRVQNYEVGVFVITLIRREVPVSSLLTVRGVSLNCTRQGTSRLVVFLAGLVLFGQCEVPQAILHIFHALNMTGRVSFCSVLSCLFSAVLS